MRGAESSLSHVGATICSAALHSPDRISCVVALVWPDTAGRETIDDTANDGSHQRNFGKLRMQRGCSGISPHKDRQIPA